MIAAGNSPLWKCRRANAESRIKPRNKNFKVLELRYFGKKGKGRFSFGRSFENLDCSGFDEFIVFLTNDGGKVRARLFAETDKGEKISKEYILSTNRFLSAEDLKVKLDGARKIKKARVELEYIDEGINGGEITLHGLILRNSTEFENYLKHWKRYSELKWKGLIQPEGYQPEFKALYGLFFSRDDLRKFRENYGTEYKKTLKSIKDYPEPEQFISSDMPSTQSCRRYLLDKFRNGFGKRASCGSMISAGARIAFAGLVNEDKAFMRLAARYALSIASFDAWTDIPLENIPGGGVWPAFTTSSTAFDLALILDLSGEMLTPKGRRYVLKALALKGVSPITYSLWARPSFHYNQGMVFLQGKIASLIIFNDVWPGVEPTLSLAKNEADQCMNNLFRPDGSYMESFAYMLYTVYVSSPSYEMYAENKNIPLSEAMPANIRNSGAYAELISSTCKGNRRIITIGQSSSWGLGCVLQIAFMAAAAPESMWVNLYNELKNKRNFASGLYGVRLKKLCAVADKGKSVVPKDLVVLKDSGLLSSLRYFHGEPLKIVMVGDSPGMGKKHYDTGSFVLEFAGDAFAMDMPIYSGLFGDAQYHNMLVPIDKSGLFANSVYYPYIDKGKRKLMRPEAVGGKISFSGRINPAPSWKTEYFKTWTRKIASETPGSIKIVDEYQLGSSSAGAAFIWLTYLPCKKSGDKVIIKGENGGRAELTVPNGCEAEIEKFSPGKKALKAMFLPENSKCNRIIFRKPGRPGDMSKISVKVKLSLKGKK